VIEGREKKKERDRGGVDWGGEWVEGWWVGGGGGGGGGGRLGLRDEMGAEGGEWGGWGGWVGELGEGLG